MKSKLIYIFLVIAFMRISAQSPSSEVVKINKAFHKYNNVAMEIISSAYQDDRKEAISESKTQVFKLPGKYLYKNKGSESMANDNYKINLDHNKKIIIVSKVTRKAPDDKHPKVGVFDQQNFQLTLDTIMSYYKDVKVKSVNEKNNELTFVFKDGMYESIKVSYDKKSYLVNDYVIFINNKNAEGEDHRFTYNIKHTYLNPSVLSSKVFDEKNYITVQKGLITPSSKFPDYKIIDNTKKEKSL
jgi:hypothetical protein